MSTIFAFIKSLAPVYERRDLLAALLQIQEEHSTTVTPMIQNVREAFGSHAFKSPLYKSFATTLGKTVQYGRANPVMLVLDSLDQLQANYPFLEKEVRRLFSMQFTTATITYDRINLLRYIESIAFYVRYARKLMLNLVADEASLIGGTPTDWSPDEKQWMIVNLEPFCGLFSAVHKTEAQLKSTLSSVSSAEYDEETAELAMRSLGPKGIDPMRLGAWSPQRNPLLALGKVLGELQVKRYKAAKEELYALQLRLQELREIQNEGRVKPNHQKFITQTEERIEKLDFDIKRFEEDNAYE